MAARCARPLAVLLLSLLVSSAAAAAAAEATCAALFESASPLFDGGEEDDDQAMLQTTPLVPSERRQTAAVTPAGVLDSEAEDSEAPGVEGGAANMEDQALLQMPAGKAHGRLTVGHGLRAAGSAGRHPRPPTPGGAEHQPATATAAASSNAVSPAADAEARARAEEPVPLAAPAMAPAAARGGGKRAPTSSVVESVFGSEFSALKVHLLQAAVLVVLASCFALGWWARASGKDGEVTASAAEPAQDQLQRRSHRDEEPARGPRAAPAPKPLPRLPHVGTSFVVPFKRIAMCQGNHLSLDVPASPAVWPLRAFLSRHSQDSPWARIDLTVDIIDAAGLPPLLSCGPARPMSEPARTGDTGATDEGPSSHGVLSTVGPKWLEVFSATGMLAAVITRSADGVCAVHREGHFSWDMEVHEEDGENRWVLVSRRGQDIGLATRLADLKLLSGGSVEGGQGEEIIQIDTQPDTSSPESVTLLMCMLAVLVFPPGPKART